MSLTLTTYGRLLSNGKPVLRPEYYNSKAYSVVAFSEAIDNLYRKAGGVSPESHSRFVWTPEDAMDFALRAKFDYIAMTRWYLDHPGPGLVYELITY